MMLAVMKVQCLTSGCCGGRVLYYDANAVAVVFPSQLAELANAVVLMLVLLIMGIKNRNRGRLYPWFMILYGVTRFVLNIFRQEWVTYDGPLMPLGNIWSLLALAAGIVWLVVLHRRAKTATKTP
jgi:prolipoprotein diacylglyceryltransferase